MAPMAPMDWEAFHRYASGRHGAVSPLVGPAFGIAPGSLRRRAAREAWPRSVHPGVLLLPGSQPGFWRDASAGLASIRDVGILSHRSAAFAQGLLPHEPPVLEGLLHRRDGTPERTGWRFHTSRTVTDDHLRRERGLWMTGPARTVLDLSTVLSPQRLAYCVIDVVRRRLVTVTDIMALLPLLASTAAGVRLAGVLQDMTDDPVDSGFELAVRNGLHASGFDPWPAPFPWRCPDGVVVHLDIAFPALWVAIECDGRGKYEQGSSFTTDRIRWTQTAGAWRLLWVDWQRWHHDRAGFLAEVRRALEGADARRPPAQPAGTLPAGA